ncbi:hypothetical protein H0A64_09160 [Alcaligenaceae bacterium]|nr:hypothetical protein [Alcaligenaceae bacterium]
MFMFRSSSLAAFLLSGLLLATSSNAQALFDVRISIRSQCSAQQPLFGPQARGAARVTCQPGATPYQSHLINMGDDRWEALGADGDLLVDGGLDTSTLRLSRKEILLAPLPDASALTAKLIYVIF